MEWPCHMNTAYDTAVCILLKNHPVHVDIVRSIRHQNGGVKQNFTSEYAASKDSHFCIATVITLNP